MNIAFLTFGCRLNRTEALDHEAQLKAAGHAVVSLAGGATPDMIIVRGCSVTAKAERDCRKAIDALRSRFTAARVMVTGCLKHPSSKLPAALTAESPIPTRTARAYVKIQDGCSGKCTFCIVPSFRGRPRSVPFDAIITRARKFIAAGYRELVVTGCNLALYRADGKGLADVLSALAMLPSPSTHRVRLGSLEPGVCDGPVLDAFAAHRNICRFLHLSVQSGSDAVLRRMNRPYGITAVERFCMDAVGRLGPRLALGADLIAGFPGETEADFDATASLARRLPFSNLHVFPYSERPGTAAAEMDGALPPSVRRARSLRLLEIGKAKRAAFAATFAGQTVEVCIEKPRRGWTAEYLDCEIVQNRDAKGPGGANASGTLARRMLVAAHVIRASGDRLVAEPIARE